MLITFISWIKQTLTPSFSKIKRRNLSHNFRTLENEIIKKGGRGGEANTLINKINIKGEKMKSN